MRNEQTLELDELLDYLRSDTTYQLGPMDTIRAKTEEMGDPCVPTAEQIVILEWLQKAYKLWAERYPIEEPINLELRKLLPAIAARSIADEEFLIPGAHVIHEMLDCIHTSAVGWQPELGRAGAALEKLIADAVANINLWLHEPERDLHKICSDVITATRKDQDRAERMTQRLIDAEKGRLKTASARWKGADMINRHLTKYQATAEIGNFLRGPWYESAQLVLLKYRADSDEWAQMTATTETLLQSLTLDASATEEERQRLFELVISIPRDVKQWLLSLQMDPQATNDAVTLIESAHMRLLRNQDIMLEPVEPIFMEGMMDARTSGAGLKRINAIDPGRWFAITQPDGTILRAQLALKLGQEQQLQFANKAGLKCLQLDYEDFLNAINNGRTTPLRSGFSFSACLAHAAGIYNLEDYSTLTGIEFETATEEVEDAGEAEAVVDEEDENFDDMEFDPEEVEKMYRENLEAERLHREREQAKESTLDGNAESTLDSEDDAARQHEQEQAEQRKQEQAEEDTFSGKAAAGGDDIEINIPMGTWLGFHDTEVPTMAKLAVHDKDQDSYIFVNREGIKMRTLNKQGLIDLLDGKLIDMLEPRTDFRDQITRMKTPKD